MTLKAAFFIQVGGVDVTGNFDANATKISVTDSSGETADTASITVADPNGEVALPGIGAEITIGLGWGVPVVIFEGFVDDVNSEGGRSGGGTITISAKSADTVSGKMKQQNEKHKDDATLEDVAKEWGKAAGMKDVAVHPSLASVERAYWSMNNESFPAWGERIARQMGATFKILGNRAAFVPRSQGLSVTGQPLPTVIARAGEGGNLISWSIKPMIGRPQHKEARTRFYDPAEARHKEKRVSAAYDTKSDATLTTRFTELDETGAESKAGSAEKETERERGSGTVTLVGDPTAQAEAPLMVVGARPGVDGGYCIDSVTHTYDRGSKFESSCQVKQPSGSAGVDDR